MLFNARASWGAVRRGGRPYKVKVALLVTQRHYRVYST